MKPGDASSGTPPRSTSRPVAPRAAAGARSSENPTQPPEHTGPKAPGEGSVAGDTAAGRPADVFEGSVAVPSVAGAEPPASAPAAAPPSVPAPATPTPAVARYVRPAPTAWQNISGTTHKLIAAPLVAAWSALAYPLFWLLSRDPKSTAEAAGNSAAISKGQRRGLEFVGGLWGPVVTRFLGGKLKVEGMENIPNAGPVIFVGNHMSYLDGVALMNATRGRAKVVLGAQLRKVPVIGWALSKIALFVTLPKHVEPGTTPEALKKLRGEEAKAMLACLKAGDSLIIFPQGGLDGGRGSQAILGPFHDGYARMALMYEKFRRRPSKLGSAAAADGQAGSPQLLSAEVPPALHIVPFSIAGTEFCLPPDKRPLPGLFSWFFPRQIRLKFGSATPVQGYESGAKERGEADPTLALIRQNREEIRALLPGLTLSDQMVVGEISPASAAPQAPPASA